MIRAISHFRKYIKWYFLILLFLLCTIVWSVVAREDRDGKLTFAVLNIGQGDALFIESPTGVQVVVDGGPNNNLMREISSVLPWYDRHVDMMVITNPDRDHYEGFFSFLDKYKTDFVLKSGTNQDSELYKSLEQKIKTKNITEVLARRGQIIDIGGGAYLQVLFPDRDVSGLSSNDGSIVMRLVYGDTSVMLQGDSTYKIEEYLMTLDKDGLESNILKIGHHGSRTSTGEEYMKAVSPEWAVISAGKDNSYGHPHKEVLDILNKQKVKILGTYDLGRIIFESDGLNFIKK
jgi:competence protein ComEC